MSAPLLAALRQHPLMLAGVAFFTVALPVVAVVIPLFAGAAVDGKEGAIGGLLLATTARFAVQGCRRFLSGTLSIRVQHSLRMAVMRRLQSIDAAEASRLSTGQLVSRSISDLGQIQSMLAMFPVVLSGFVEVLLISVVLVWMSPPIAVLMLAHIPVMFLIAARSRRRLYPATWLAQQQQADIASHIEQSVTGVRVVKNFAQQPAMISRFDGLARVLYGLRMRVGRLTAIFQSALSSIPNAMLVATIVLGGWLALRGDLSLGEFLAAATYVTLLARLIRMTASMLVTVFLARAAVRRVEEIMDLPVRPQPAADNSKRPALGLRGHIPARTPTDAPLHIDIPAGSHAVISGPAASGKSFVARALAGLDSAASSDLSVVLPDATTRPLLDLPEPQRPVVVLDEPFLYSATIAENIRLGLDASDSEVMDAARIACADEFIDRIGGLGTVVGERGLTLSGGQRQRIALARAVLRRPSVLILDDATSAIDAATERRILDNLGEVAGDMTVISISHRLEDGALPPGAPADTILIDLPTPPRQELWPDNPPKPLTNQAEPPAGVDGLKDGLEVPTVADYTAPFSIRSLISLVPGLLAAVVATLLVTVIADVTLPSFIRHALDDGVAQGDQSVVNRTALIALLIVAVSWIALSLNTVLTMRAGERLLYALRLRSFRHLNRLDMGWYETQSSGQIMTRLTTDIDSLSNFLQSGLSQFIVSVTVLLGVLGMLVYTDLTLTGITALFLPVIAVAAWVFKRVSSRLYSEARSQVSQVNSTFQESITGLVTAQAYGYAPALFQRLEAESLEYRRLRTKAQAAVSVFFPGINWLTDLAQASILALGASLVASGQTTQGAVVAFSLYLTVFFTPVQQLSQIFDAFQQAKVGLDRIGIFLRTQPGVPTRGTANTPASVGSPAIVFDDVAFAYGLSTDASTPTGTGAKANGTPHSEHAPVKSPVVELSARFEGTTALVGATGAGKSTIAKLISRWYDPQQGQILADFSPEIEGDDTQRNGTRAVNIADVDLQAWRRTVGTVPQEPHLFPTTVAENIAFGKPDATRAEIERAVTAIGGEEIIATIPGGYLAPVAEQGQGLSAGQRQIIALARAELIQPAVMVLDEATATLPADVERTVVQAIAQAASGRTAIIIAHRLSTAARADRIVVLDHGRIVESGTHHELLNSGGYYARLWKHQM